jgi:hypothetical protein
MKKVKFISVAAFVVVVVTLSVLNSCGKQEITDLDKSIGKKVILSEKDNAILNKIIAVKEKMFLINTNPNYKSTEVTSVDSAIWYLDATMNLSHAFISWEILSNFYFDSVFVTINNNEGWVNYSDMAIAYDELKQKITSVCIEAPGSEKELYITTLTQKADEGDSVIIKADITIGSRTNTPDYHPFETGWNYGDLLGDCSFQSAGIADACTVLRDKTNEFRYLYVNDEQMLYIGIPNEEPYVVLHSEDPVFVNVNDPNPEDNYYEHLLVYQKQSWVYHDCIDETEMNWYYHRLNDVIYDMVPNNQEHWPNAYGKTFIEIKADLNPINGTFGTKENSPRFIIRHQYKVEYRYAIYVGGRSEPTSITEN